MATYTVWIDNISDQSAVKAYLLQTLSETQGYSYNPSEGGNCALLIFVDKTDTKEFLDKEYTLFTATMSSEAFLNIEAKLSPECRSAIEKLTTNQLELLNFGVLQTTDQPNVVAGSLTQLKYFETTLSDFVIHNAESKSFTGAVDSGKSSTSADNFDKYIGIEKTETDHLPGDGASSRTTHTANLNVFENVSGEVAPWISSAMSFTVDNCDPIKEMGNVTISEDNGKHVVHCSSLDHLKNTQSLLFSFVMKRECSLPPRTREIPMRKISLEEDI